MMLYSLSEILYIEPQSPKIALYKSAIVNSVSKVGTSSLNASSKSLSLTSFT